MTYEQYLEETIRPGSFVIDIGANIGEVAECYANLGATVLAIEPGELAYKELLKRAVSLKSPGKIVPLKIGIDEKVCHKSVFHYDNWTLIPSGDTRQRNNVFVEGHGYRQFKQGEPFSVDFCSLERLFIHELPHSPVFIKIDVDGYEGRVVRGGRKILSNTPFVIEIGRKTIRELEERAEDLVNLLFQMNLIVYPTYPQLSHALPNAREVMNLFEPLLLETTLDFLCVPSHLKQPELS